MTYHCPECKKELQKGKYSIWVNLLIGPIFGQLLRPLICNDHGEIKADRLQPEEMRTVKKRRLAGIIGGAAANFIVLIALVFFYLNT